MDNKYLDDPVLNEALENYFNNLEVVNEGLFKFLKKLEEKDKQQKIIEQEKKKAEELGLTSDQYKKYINYKLDSEELKKANIMFDNFRKYTLDLFRKLKSNSEFKKKVNDEYNKYKDELDEDFSKFPPLKIFDYDNIGNDGEGMIEIFRSQYDSNIYNFVYKYIIKDMKQNHKDIDFNYNTGDGDEGCLWVNIWTEKFKKYIINKIKQES